MWSTPSTFNTPFTEMKGNMWNEYNDCDGFVITTNGYTKRNNAAVMGRGIARQAKDSIPGLDMLLGHKIIENGNITQWVTDKIIALPVKHTSEECVGDNVVKHLEHRYELYQEVPGWACKASLFLIEHSIQELVILADTYNLKRIVLPRPGCGAGELKYQEQVRNILIQYLDDRFEVWTY